MKKILAVISAALLSAVMLFCGCGAKDGIDGRDGKDGQSVTLDEVYQRYIDEYGDITYEDFLYKFFSYTNEELDNVSSLQSIINRSLMSGVSILTSFTYSETYRNSMGGISTRKTYSVFAGSGVILWLNKEAGDAYVVTNCHVIYADDSDDVYCKDVRLYLYGQDIQDVNYKISLSGEITDDENYRIPAEVIGASITYDIALLKVSGSEVLKRSNATAASFSTEEDVYVGEYVYAVGNAAFEGMSASGGIISKDSEIIEISMSDLNPTDYNEYRVMRVTAPLNHGNSGGGLFNKRGEIVGIVNSKDQGEDVDNMGYVLPASNVRRLLKLMYDSYQSQGRFSAGVSVANTNIDIKITDAYAVYNEQTNRAEIRETVKVISVNGAPARNNLNVGDVLLNIKVVGADNVVKENVKITRSYHFKDTLLSVERGDEVILTVERAGENVEVALQFISGYYFSVVR